MSLTISVIVCAYNEVRFLPACLATLARQTRLPDEIVIVNNASTDGTRAIAVSTPGVRVVDEPRKGLVIARETGRRQARVASCSPFSTRTARRRRLGSRGWRRSSRAGAGPSR